MQKTIQKDTRPIAHIWGERNHERQLGAADAKWASRLIACCVFKRAENDQTGHPFHRPYIGRESCTITPSEEKKAEELKTLECNVSEAASRIRAVDASMSVKGLVWSLKG